MSKIGELATKVVRLYDTVAAETNMIVKNKKDEYIDIDLFISLLAALWGGLSDEQKMNISIPFADAIIDFKANELKIEKLRKKSKKVPLLYFITPADTYTKNLIAYDTDTYEFGLCTQINKNQDHYWFFRPTFHSFDAVISYLNTNKNEIKHKNNIIDFLMQNVNIEEIYFKTSQDE